MTKIGRTHASWFKVMLSKDSAWQLHRILPPGVLVFSISYQPTGCMSKCPSKRGSARLLVSREVCTHYKERATIPWPLACVEGTKVANCVDVDTRCP